MWALGLVAWGVCNSKYNLTTDTHMIADLVLIDRAATKWVALAVQHTYNNDTMYPAIYNDNEPSTKSARVAACDACNHDAANAGNVWTALVIAS